MVSWIGKNLPDGKQLVADNAVRGINLIDVTSVPRLSFAQKLDCLSSQAKIAGHRAVLEACILYGKFTAPEITAAGKYAPARVMVGGPRRFYDFYKYVGVVDFHSWLGGRSKRRSCQKVRA